MKFPTILTIIKVPRLLARSLGLYLLGRIDDHHHYAVSINNDESKSHYYDSSLALKKVMRRLGLL